MTRENIYIPRSRCGIEDQGDKLILTLPTTDNHDRTLMLLAFGFFMILITILALLQLRNSDAEWAALLCNLSFYMPLFTLLIGLYLLINGLWLLNGREIIEISDSQLIIRHQLYSFSKQKILPAQRVSNFQPHLSHRPNPWLFIGIWDYQRLFSGFWDFQCGRLTLEYQSSDTLQEIGFGNGLFENEAKALYKIILERLPVYQPSTWKESKEA